MASHLTPASEREGLLRARKSSSESAEPSAPTHPVLTLQRQVGNSQIQRMLVQREAAPEEEELAMKRDAAIQRDAAPEEEELAMKRDPAIQREAAPEEEELAMKRDPAIQREGAPEEEELAMKRDPAIQREGAVEDEEPVQAKPEGAGVFPEVGPEGGRVSAGIEARIHSKRGTGSPLESGTRATMENAFGESFEGVRLHQDGESDSLNRSLGARAFTTGNDIFFRQDASSSDHELLGHELTHVVQQRSGAVSNGEGMTVGAADDAFEREADTSGAAIAAGTASVQAKRDID